MIDLIQVGILRDGGTKEYIEKSVEIKTTEDFHNCTKYYLDNRVTSKTKGELFKGYPSDSEAIMLDKLNYNLLDYDNSNNRK